MQVFAGVFTACVGAYTASCLYLISHSALSFWFAAFFGLIGGNTIGFAFRGTKIPGESEISAEEKKTTCEDRLDELERLKRRDMVTPEEYAAKRQEILKDL